MLCSETWEKQDNSQLHNEIEKMLELDDVEFISCPRPKKKRGGDCAIIVNHKKSH